MERTALKLNVLERFKEKVYANPKNDAIIFENDVLSYEKLYQNSLKFADYLVTFGIKPGDVVALSMEKSIDFIIALLGILFAGAIYMPLDPKYPKSRLEYMCNEALPELLVTDEVSGGAFSFFQGKKIDAKEAFYFSESEKVKDISLPVGSLEDLAYIIFTSGSTGNPKGVPIQHKGLVNAVVGRFKFYKDPICTILVSSISFDMSLMTIFHSLLSGGTLIIPENSSKFDLDRLFYCMEKNSVDYLLSIPSLYQLLLQRGDALKKLKYVVLGGEGFQQSLVEMHKKLQPNTYLFNEYGLTECSICSTAGLLYDQREKKTYPITVGKPIENTEIFIIDEDKNILTNGKVGEICIHGIALTQGYLNNDKANREKFVSIQRASGEMIVPVYKTGDYGRILSTGEIEYRGRLDRQVKIRGHRIELEEIEHVLSKYPGIERSVVDIESNKIEQKLIIAYYSSRKPISDKCLKGFLKKTLPDFSIPSKFIYLDKFSLTPNGKIDQNALKCITQSFDETKFSNEKLEDDLLNIWKKTLSRTSIKLSDNFFDIGGDSFSVAVVQTAIKQDMNLEVSIMELFEYPTISKLASHLERSVNTFSSLKKEGLPKTQKPKFRRLQVNKR